MAKKIRLLLCTVPFLLVTMNGYSKSLDLLYGVHVNIIGDIMSPSSVVVVPNTPGEFTTVSSVSIDSNKEASRNGQFDIAVLLGIEILNMFDIYGKFGYAYSQQTQKDTSLKNQLMMTDHSLFFDANTRVLFPVFNPISAYVDVGGGINFEMYKTAEYASIDSYGWIQDITSLKVYDSAQNHELTRLYYINVGVGATFQISRVDRIGIGYSAKYYFSSLFNKDTYKLKNNAGTTIKFNFSNAQFLHGISLEYIRLF